MQTCTAAPKQSNLWSQDVSMDIDHNTIKYNNPVAYI